MLFFVDTNILIYSRDPKHLGKQRVATAWLRELASREIAVINLQVLNELCHVALRKLIHLNVSEVRNWTERLRAFGDTPIDADIVEGAWSIHVKYRRSWFDCLLLSSAERLKCTHFLTEDMGAGSLIGSLALVHPFETDPIEFLAEG